MIENLISTNMILYCRNWAATVRFYRDGLGLPVLFSNEWFVEFQLTDSSRLSIADENHASIKSCENTGITIGLQTRNIDAVWTHSEKMRLSPSAIREHPWNARTFYLFDPEGHRIEVWQSHISQ